MASPKTSRSRANARARSAPERTLAPSLLCLLLALAPSCSAPGLGIGAAPRRQFEPTLEQIFLGNQLIGRPPELVAMSPDGESLLARWSPSRADEKPARGALRLIDTAGARPGEACGIELARLLPPPPRLASESAPASAPAGAEVEPGEHGEAATGEPEHWLYAKSDPSWLLVSRGNGLYRVDPRLRDVREILAESERTFASAPSSAPGSAPRRLGTIERLEWNRAGTELRVWDEDDLYAFDVPDLGTVQALDLAQARHVSEPLSARASRVQWSQDSSVAFSPNEPIVKAADPSTSQPTSQPESQPASAPSPPESSTSASPEPGPAQIYRLDENRAVVLEGFDDLKGREQESLSPDGRWVFALSRDTSHHNAPIPVPDFLSERTRTTEGRREMAEDGPWRTELYVWDCLDGSQRSLRLPQDGNYWFEKIGWAPVSNDATQAIFAFRVASADFRTRDLLVSFDGPSLLRVPLADEDERWVGGPADDVRWHPSEPLLYAGRERTGRCQLYAHPPGTAQPTAGICGVGGIPPLEQPAGSTRWPLLTNVEGELASYTPTEEGVVICASRTDPAQHWIGLVPPADTSRWYSWPPVPQPVRWLSQPEGFNDSCHANRDASVVAFLHEELGQPAEIWCTRDGVARQLSDTIPAEFRRIDWVLPKTLCATSRDGTEVYAHAYLPPGDPWTWSRARRPCIVFVHGAGYLQNVTDSMTEYPLNFMFHTRLAKLGYAVVDVDYRGSKGYGNKFRTDVQFRLGEKELEDIHAVLDELSARGCIERERVALYGGSYGGFLTLMALFKEPGRWRGGAALRSVTDWRSYTPGYTQPRLGKPSEQAEAYAFSSPIDHAAGLADPLLLLHGLRDENVFAQDTIRLMEKLILLGKDFEVMLYPSQGHGFDSGPHWLDEYKRIEEFLRRVLEAPAARPAAP